MSKVDQQLQLQPSISWEAYMTKETYHSYIRGLSINSGSEVSLQSLDQGSSYKVWIRGLSMKFRSEI